MIKHTDLYIPTYLQSHLDRAYHRVLNSSTFILGAEVEAFELEWSEYNNTPHCVACANGFDALQLCMRAFNVKPADHVLVPAFTAPPVWSSVLSLRALPVVHDEPICPSVSIYVNLFGFRAPATQTPITIEDASQSHGLQPNPSANATVHSFYPTKNLGALGDAGAILTNDAALASELRLLRNYGKSLSINSRLDPLQAAFLRAKLRFLNHNNFQRAQTASIYNEHLCVLPIELPDSTAETVWHQYVIRCTHGERDRLRSFLSLHQIETLIHYPIPPHILFDTHDPLQTPSLADALLQSQQVLSLPIAPHITQSDAITICNAISQFYSEEFTQ